MGDRKAMGAVTESGGQRSEGRDQVAGADSEVTIYQHSYILLIIT